MENYIKLEAYDENGNQLPFEFSFEKFEEGDVTRVKFKAKSISEVPVYPALLKIFQWESKEKSLHVFKPGFNKPSDNAWFYTLEIGKPIAKCNTFISDCLKSFSDTSLLISTMSVIQTSEKEWALWGATSFEAFHNVIEYDVSGNCVVARLWLEGDQSQFDPDVWVDLEEITVIKDTFVSCIDIYCKTLTDRYGKKAIKPMSGWSDWEYYRIPGKTENAIMESVETFGNMKKDGWPIDSVVIDAGWCEHIYHYDEITSKFPNGPEWLCEKIDDNSAIPGLWIAPWLTTKNSKMAKEHPEWLAIDRTTNQPRCIHRSDGEDICTIDYSVPEAVEWFRGQMKMMVGWGWKYFKLDGPVFSHYLNVRFYDPYSTRYKQINVIMRMLKEEFSNVLIESEGVYGPAIGVADFHRICQDEHPHWYGSMGEERLAENIPTTLCSGIFNGRLWANLNLLVLRDAPTPYYENILEYFVYKLPEWGQHEHLLTQTELHSAITSAWFTNSAIFYSAPLSLTMRSPYHAECFRRLLPSAGEMDTIPCDVEKDFPTIYKTICGGKAFMHIYNFDESYKDETNIPLSGEFHVYDYWNEEYIGITDNIKVRDLAPRGCRLYWLTPVEDDIQLVGATAHIAGIGVELKENTDGTYALKSPSFYDKEQSVTISLPAEVKLSSPNADKMLFDYRNEGRVKITFNAEKEPIILTKKKDVN